MVGYKIHHRSLPILQIIKNYTTKEKPIPRKPIPLPSTKWEKKPILPSKAVPIYPTEKDYYEKQGIKKYFE